jgi:hypothetical protein
MGMTDNEQLTIDNGQLDETNVGVDVSGDPSEATTKRSIADVRRKLKHGGYSAALIAVFLVGAVLINVVFGMLLDRFNFRFDLTERGLFSIEQSTFDYLSELDDTINFYFCTTEENFTARMDTLQVYEIAQRFTEANRNFTITFVNRLADPAFAEGFGGALNDYDIVIESERTGRFEVVGPMDYFIPEFYFQGERVPEHEARQADFLGHGDLIERSLGTQTEQVFLSAIMRVSDTTPVRVGFVSSFGEFAYRGMMSLLNTNGYLVEEIDLLMAAEIDPEIDFLVICSPEFDYTADARSKVEVWLDNGGMYGKTLLYFPAFDVLETPVLDAFFAEWGVRIEKGLISQTNTNFAFPLYEFGLMQLVNMLEGDFSEGIDEDALVAWIIRPVTLLYESLGSTHTSALVESFQGSVYSPFSTDDLDDDWRPVNEILNIATLSRKTRIENNERLSSHVLIFGSPTIFDADILESPLFDNSKLLLNIFGDISGRSEVSLHIMPKSFRATGFQITTAQSNAITVIFVIVLPVIIIAAGLVVYFRRRYR